MFATRLFDRTGFAEHDQKYGPGGRFDEACLQHVASIAIRVPGGPISRHRGGQEARGRGIGFRGPDLPGGSVFEARGTENGAQKQICRIPAFIEKTQSKIEISSQKLSPQGDEP